MVSAVSKVWASLKRNPVLNAFAAAVLVQVAEDFVANEIQWNDLFGYVGMVFIGVATRTFVVPVRKYDEGIDKAFAEGVYRGQSDRNTY